METGQLFKEIGGNTISWSSGGELFFISHKLGAWRLPVAVECRIGNLEATDENGD